MMAQNTLLLHHHHHQQQRNGNSNNGNLLLLSKIENAAFILDRVISAKWIMSEYPPISIEDANSLLQTFYSTNSSKLLPLFLKIHKEGCGYVIEPCVGVQEVSNINENDLTLYSVRKHPENYDISSEINITSQNQRLLHIAPSILINPELKNFIVPDFKKVKIEETPISSNMEQPILQDISKSSTSTSTTNPKKQSSMMSFLKKK